MTLIIQCLSVLVKLLSITYNLPPVTRLVPETDSWYFLYNIIWNDSLSISYFQGYIPQSYSIRLQTQFIYFKNWCFLNLLNIFTFIREFILIYFISTFHLFFSSAKFTSEMYGCLRPFFIRCFLTKYTRIKILHRLHMFVHFMILIITH